MHSVLKLVFALKNGRTVIKEQFVSGAMKVVRPFEVEGYALLQIASVTPGIHNGDHYEVEVQVEEGARVILLNQSATKLHGKRDGEAVHHIEIQVQPGAHLEYCPGLTLPFEDAHYRQSTHIDLKEGAQCGLLESWAAGRIERGEVWRFQHLQSRIQVDLDGKPLYRDAFQMSGGLLEGITDGHLLWASGFWHGLPALPAGFESGSSVKGWGTTRSGSQYLRMFGSDTLEFQKDLTRFVQQRWQLASGVQIPWSRFSSGVLL